MRSRRVVLWAVGSSLALGLFLAFKGGEDPADLAYWMKITAEDAGGADDTSAEASFARGMAVIRSHLVQYVDQVPVLSKIPIVGKSFRQMSFSIDNSISDNKLAEAYGWIKISAANGFAPAQEALKLFPAGGIRALPETTEP